MTSPNTYNNGAPYLIDPIGYVRPDPAEAFRSRGPNNPPDAALLAERLEVRRNEYSRGDAGWKEFDDYATMLTNFASEGQLVNLSQVSGEELANKLTTAYEREWTMSGTAGPSDAIQHLRQIQLN